MKTHRAISSCGLALLAMSVFAWAGDGFANEDSYCQSKAYWALSVLD